MNRSQPFTLNTQNANYEELINSIKFLLPAMDDYIAKTQELYNYFYEKEIEITESFSYETQQQDPVLQLIFLWKQNKKSPTTPILTIQNNKGLPHYNRRFQDVSNKSALILHTKNTIANISFSFCLLLGKFHSAHSHDLSAHPDLEKTYSTITENYHFLFMKTWIAVLTQYCLNYQRSTSMQFF